MPSTPKIRVIILLKSQFFVKMLLEKYEDKQKDAV